MPRTGRASHAPVLAVSLCLVVAAGWLSAAVASPADPTSPTVPTLSWHHEGEWDKAFGSAITEDRRVLIDFYAEWCGPCKLLDRRVYPDSAVASELSELIRIKVDVDTPVGEKLGEDFGVFSMPTLVLCDAYGREIDRIRGYKPPDEFLVLIRDYVAGRGTLTDLESRLRRSPADASLRMSLGRKYADRSDLGSARICLAPVVTDTAEVLRPRAMLLLADLESRAGNTERAITIVREVQQDYQREVGDKWALRTIARFQDRAGDPLAALATYRDLVAEAPEDPRVLDGFASRAADLGVALEEAMIVSRRAVELSGREAKYMSTLAEVHRQLEQYSAAKKWARRAATEAPDDPLFRERLERISREAIGG